MRRVGRAERDQLMETHVTPHGKSPGQGDYIRSSAPITAIGPMGDSLPQTNGICHRAAFTSPGPKCPTKGKLELSPLSP